MSNIIDDLWELSLHLVPTSILRELTITGFWRTALWFRPYNEVRFRCNFVIAQTRYQGCAFYSMEISEGEIEQLLGTHVLEARRSCVPLQVALLDSVFGFLVNDLIAARVLEISGTSQEKALWRARIVGEEVEELLHALNLVSHPAHIALVGASALILDELLALQCTVDIFDLDPTIIGTNIRRDMNIIDGKSGLSSHQPPDIIVATGMTLTTETLDDILAYARYSGAKVVIYAQTGANIAPWYRRYGADSIVSEPIPFYDFEGVSKIRVFRNKSSLLA